jgi:hypothetical protein
MFEIFTGTLTERQLGRVCAEANVCMSRGALPHKRGGEQFVSFSMTTWYFLELP